MWVLFLELACWQVMVNHHSLYLEGTLSATSPLAMRPTIMTSSTNHKRRRLLEQEPVVQTDTHTQLRSLVHTWNVRQKKFTQIKMSYSFKFVEEVYPPPLLPGFLVEGKMMMGFLKQSPRETPKPYSRQAVSADSTLLFAPVCVSLLSLMLFKTEAFRHAHFNSSAWIHCVSFITLLLHLVEWFV